jgi:hypothetical protein
MNIDTAAHTVPVTWNNGGSTVTAQFPVTATHTMYADASHTATVTQLADMPQQVQLDSSVSSTGVSDGVAALFLGCLIWYAHKHKGVHWGWAMVGVALGTFIGSGTFGVMIHDSVGQLLGSLISSVSGVA